MNVEERTVKSLNVVLLLGMLLLAACQPGEEETTDTLSMTLPSTHSTKGFLLLSLTNDDKRRSYNLDRLLF